MVVVRTADILTGAYERAVLSGLRSRFRRALRGAAACCSAEAPMCIGDRRVVWGSVVWDVVARVRHACPG